MTGRRFVLHAAIILATGGSAFGAGTTRWTGAAGDRQWANPANWTDPSGKLAFIPVLLAIWAVAEIGLQIYDTYDTIKTALDPCVSGWEKGAVVGMYIAGVFLPGGGYGTGGRWSRVPHYGGEWRAQLRRAREGRPAICA